MNRSQARRSLFLLLAIFFFAGNLRAVAEPAQTNRPKLLSCGPHFFEADKFGRCAWKDEQGILHISQDRLRKLHYDKRGLAVIFVDGFYYVARDGRAAPVEVFDNGAEEFSDGLARSSVGKKIGYINRESKLVIPAQFDGAYRFEHGLAVVCVGCRLTWAEPEKEHSYYVGGDWTYIDVHGRVVSAWSWSPKTTFRECPREKLTK